jgi:putative PIN family toxin of toxin-antitoxin system
VVDTSTLMAARWKPGSASDRILELCLKGRVQALVSPGVERENRHILAKVNPPEAFQKRLEAFFTSARTIQHGPVLRVAEDPDDDKFIECAVAGKADYIISADRHLLDLDGYENIRSCRAGAFLEENPSLRDSESG